MARAKNMSGQIFISYRREESRWSARSLHDRLCRDFDRKQIFMDIDAIALGEDFVEAIETMVAKCDVLIAVIGNNWLISKDDHGNRRLDNPEDFVRMEIGAALKRKIRVIPVLVDGALMPQPTDLPEDLKPLVRRNALQITDVSFEGDCQRLAAAIRLVLQKAAAEEKERLGAEQRQREEKERLEAEQREKERLEAKQLEEQRLEAEQREERRLEAEQREKQRLETEQLEKRRLEAEQREEKERQKARGPAQGETPPTIQGQGSAVLKSLTLRAPLVVLALILIVGLIWFVGSKRNYVGREAALGTPMPTPTATLSPVSPGPAFYIHRGDTYRDAKDYDKAISDYNEAIRLNPNDASAYYNRALAYYYKNDYDKAISDYSEAIRLNPNSAQAYGDRGAAYRHKNDYDKAISDYNEAIRLNPNNASAYYNRALAYYYKNDYDKAISDYNEAIRLNPDSAQAYSNRGAAYRHKNDYDKAISDYNEAISLNPNDAEAYYNRGIAYRARGANTQAQADFDKAKQLGYIGTQ
jgi:tetratricopeptide (TPR) repeat protein